MFRQFFCVSRSLALFVRSNGVGDFMKKPFYILSIAAISILLWKYNDSTKSSHEAYSDVKNQILIKSQAGQREHIGYNTSFRRIAQRYKSAEVPHIETLPPAKEDKKKLEKADSSKDPRKNAKKPDKKKKKTVAKKTDKKQPKVLDDKQNKNAEMENNDITPSNVVAAIAKPQTAEQWFYYLSAQATQIRFDEFVQAYKDQSLSSNDFYSVLKMLLQSNQDQLHAYALATLKAESNYESFYMLAEFSQSSNLSSENMNELESILLSYQSLNKMGILLKALSADLNAVHDPALEFIRNLASSSPGAQRIARQSNRQNSESSSSLSFFQQVYVSLSSMLDNSKVSSSIRADVLSLQSFIGSRFGIPSTGNASRVARS